MLLFAMLIGFAALNLVANFVVPAKLKLVLVPAFALLMIVVVAKSFRRQP